MKYIIIVLASLLLSACATDIEKQSPICTASAKLSGQEYSVNIYGIRKVSNQTQYKAGYPFNWKWVSQSNFTHSTCK